MLADAEPHEVDERPRTAIPRRRARTETNAKGSGMTLILTCATGFVGDEVKVQLLATPAQILCLSRRDFAPIPRLVSAPS